MLGSSWLLIATAAGVGLLHTAIGLDHSLPFVVLARSQRWSLKKLLSITALCGLAHVLSSVAIGVVGIAAGVALDRLDWIENARGGLAARLLIGFGLAYAVWGVYRAWRGQPHAHVETPSQARALSIAGLLLVFVLGPCEALIPLLAVPAYDGQWLLVAAVVGAFGGATVLAMLVLVGLGYLGLRWRGFGVLERYMHALAGMAIASSGLAIQWLGL